MKAAFYINEGAAQIILTAEDKFEMRLLERFHDKDIVTVRRGSFYECQGGWIREGDANESTIFVLGIKPTEEETPQ